MNCPYCGNEMTRGWVQSASKVLFTTARKEGGFVFGNKHDVVLTANNFVNPSCVAYLCNVCEKVVIDYAEKEKC